jgi:hypothetical protein
MQMRAATILATAMFLGGDVTSDPPPLDACVRLGYGLGSGTIICVDGETAYGLTVSHLASKSGSTIVFENRDGTTGTATFVGRDKSSDLALFRCQSKDVTTFAPVLVSRTSGIISGAGYTASRKGKLKLEVKGLKALEDVRISNLKGVRSAYAVTKGKFANGDSGGSVFQDGSLVSVLSHGEDDKRALGATHDQIVAFLRENGAKDVGGQMSFGSVEKMASDDEPREDPKDWGDKDRTREIIELWKVVRGLGKGEKGDKGETGSVADLSKLQSQLDDNRKLISRIVSTPVTVQILDPTTGEVITEKRYPYGTPIKLILPTKARATR